LAVLLFFILPFRAQSQSSGDNETTITRLIKRYEKELKNNPDDYDTAMVLAKLYLVEGHFKKAEKLYKRILEKYPQDVDALKGLGDVYLYSGKEDKAIYYYQKALEIEPGSPYLLFALAKAYAWSEQYDRAIAIYEQILEQNENYAEAWPGLGKMYYWKNQPYTALRYYEKALALAPDDNFIREEYEKILRETSWQLYGQFKSVKEQEEAYSIDALTQRIIGGKRLSDTWEISATHFSDWSNRDYTDSQTPDTSRWYRSAYLTGTLHASALRLSAYAGYSFSDDQWSGYGLEGYWSVVSGKTKWTFQAATGYDYYYYWNNIGHYTSSGSVKLQHKRWRLEAGVEKGLTDKAPVYDILTNDYVEAENPFWDAHAGIAYTLIPYPHLRLGFSYDFITYTYKSPMYYSPMDKSSAGPEIFFYHQADHWYISAFASAQYGREYDYEITTITTGGHNGTTQTIIQKVPQSTSQLTADLETGFNGRNWSLGLSAGYYQTPYYQSNQIGVHFRWYFLPKKR